jgi:hypothetical protein
VRYFGKMTKLNIIYIFFTAFVIQLAYLLNYFFMLQQFKAEYPEEMKQVSKDVNFGDLDELLWGELYGLMENHRFWEINVTSNQIFISFYMCIITIILVLGYEHERYTTYHRRYMIWKNNILVLLVFIMFFLYVIYFAIYFTVVGITEEKKNYYFPHYILWIILFVHIILLVIGEYLIKKVVINQYNRDQTRLKLFYEIKLGMYSPK